MYLRVCVYYIFVIIYKKKKKDRKVFVPYKEVYQYEIYIDCF